MRLASLAAQAGGKSGHDIPLDDRMSMRDADHRDGFEPIELKFEFLACFPVQELGHRHRPILGNAHVTASGSVLYG